MENIEKRVFNKERKSEFCVPSEELVFEFARSSAPGGQYVNKVSSKVRVRWNFENSSILTPFQKQRIKKLYSNRITEKGELIVESQELRSQARNRARAIERLNDLVFRALKRPRRRISTKIPKRVKEKRLQEKKRQSEKKRLRKPIRAFNNFN